MGECGCGSGNEMGRFKAAGGWYVFAVYAGCEQCSGVTGVSVVFYTDEQLAEYRLDHLPDWTGRTKDEGFCGVSVPVLDWDVLAKEVGECGFDLSEYDSGENFIMDSWHSLRMAVVTTLNGFMGE